jgi:hypothetical protein
MSPNPVFAKIMYITFIVEEVVQKFWLLLYIISKKLAKVNNHPKGENSPKLVTLAITFLGWQTFAQSGTDVMIF